MAFCGVHFRKLKTASHINKACSHDRRSHMPANVNKGRVSQNIALLDHGRDRWEFVNEQITKRVKRKVRDNAVRMVEAFIYSSPEYFRPADPDKKGTWDDARLKTWVENAHKWLLSEFSEENLLEVHLHLDESTPHIHACILPITDDGRLNAKEYLMNRVGLRNAQTSLAKALTPLGLTRGLKGSGAKHIAADTWAAEIQNCLNTRANAPEPEPSGKLPFVPAFKYKKLEGDYRAVVKALRKAEKRATHTQTVEAENKQLKQLNSAYARDLEQLRPLAKQVRGIEIQQVLEDYDCHNVIFLDEKGRARSYRDQRWIGRNAIDVLMHFNEIDYKTAVPRLYQKYSINEVATCVLESQRSFTRNEIIKMHNQVLAIKKFDPEWREREINQRTYYILYKRNVEAEIIKDFNVWENENGRFLKNKNRDYHIWDKGDRLILRKAVGADRREAVRLMLEIAADKKWDLSDCVTTAFGSEEFKDEVKKQVTDRLLRQTQKEVTRWKPKPMGH